MHGQDIILLGAPVQSGVRQPGCLMGPDAFRTAGLGETLAHLGHGVVDAGNVVPRPVQVKPHPNPRVHHLAQTIGWTKALEQAGFEAAGRGFPLFMGGDHSLSLGSVSGVARHAAAAGRPLFVLWLDAHPDFHTPRTTLSGNLHGTPLAYLCGLPGFEDFPRPAARLEPSNLCIIGARSVDPAEHEVLAAKDICLHDMRAVDEHGIASLLGAFVERVRAANGFLHISLDVDFLDPQIAPAVGTTVPGGATFREAHLLMEILHDSALVTSLDLVELNPFLDEKGRTASLMVELVASLMGKKIFDRPTRSF